MYLQSPYFILYCVMHMAYTVYNLHVFHPQKHVTVLQCPTFNLGEMQKYRNTEVLGLCFKKASNLDVFNIKGLLLKRL